MPLIEWSDAFIINIKEIEKLIPICASCKKLRDGKGFWRHVDAHLVEQTFFKPNNGICLDCAKSLYPDFYENNDTTNRVYIEGVHTVRHPSKRYG